MEPVSANHITRLKTTPDIDKKILTVEAHTATGNPSAVVSVVVSEGGKVVATGKAMQGQPFSWRSRMPDYGVLKILSFMI